ncbi:MAG: GNAT family N-acetyltransferase, partial [Acidimicrobiales bacterium]
YRECPTVNTDPNTAVDVTIRPYEARDRQDVRRVCYMTGYMGERVDWLWRDEESFADMFTSYYTDVEPESAFVAELDGVVAGYLLGCVETFEAWSPSMLFFRQLVRRQIAFRPGTAGMVWRSFGDVVADSVRRRPFPVPVKDERWPAHLHVDLLASVRGKGVGAVLIRRWLERLRDLRSPGCHLETLGENSRAISFFESTGFRRYREPSWAPGLRSPGGDRHTVQAMILSFEDSSTQSEVGGPR